MEAPKRWGGRGLKNCRYFFELLQICKSYTGRYGYSLVAKQTSGLEVPGSNPASKIKNKIKNMCHLLLFAGSEVILDVESLPNLLRSLALRNYNNFSEKVQGSGSGRDKHLFTGSRAVDPDPNGFANIFSPGSAFNMRIH